MEGSLEDIRRVNSVLQDNNLRGVLIGGVGRAYHIAQRNRRLALRQLPRKDTDVLMLDYVDPSQFKDDNLDIFYRFQYQNGERDFPYWVNHHTVLSVTMPNVDDLGLKAPGLYVPDELFLLRMKARISVSSTFEKSSSGGPFLPEALSDCDPMWNFRLIWVSLRRRIFGDPEGVLSMDDIIMNPLTNHEKNLVLKYHESSKST